MADVSELDFLSIIIASVAVIISGLAYRFKIREVKVSFWNRQVEELHN